MIQIRPWQDPLDIERICNLVNGIYVTAEEGIWRPDKNRIEPQELNEKKKTHDVYLAWAGDEIVGTVCGIKESTDIYRFEMLSVEPKMREFGVGSQLVEHIEKRATELGCNEIQFELLHPTQWAHPGKERMKSWYLKRGYKIIRQAPVEEFYPQSLKYLITEANFTIWSKPVD